MANYVIIPAAGTGSRMGAQVPKQYLHLHGKPLIAHCLEVFTASKLIDHVYVVLSPDDQTWKMQMNAFDFGDKVSCLYAGGDTRAATVRNGLLAVQPQTDAEDWILVHDAARPGLSNGLLTKLIESLQGDAVGGLLAMPVADTLKKVQGDSPEIRVENTVSRQGLWQAQTPQMFRYHLLKTALQLPQDAPTDEAQAIEILGHQPKLITGALRNLKVTYPQDLDVVSALMQVKE